MGYHDLSGRPWEVMADWMNALSGGSQGMKDAGAIPPSVKLPVLSMRRLTFKGTPVPGSNPSVCMMRGELFVSVRCGGVNLLGVIDHDGVLREPRELSGVYAPDEREGNPCRLFVWRDQLCATVCVAEPRPQGIPHAEVGVITIDGGRVTTLRRLRSERYEKNWMPCVDGDRLRFVYATDPLLVLDEPFDTAPLPAMKATLRGGTQLTPYRDGWLACVHTTHTTSMGPVYMNRFVSFDRGLTHAKVGAPFHLQKFGVEITGGIATDEGRVLLSFGIDEHEAWLAVVDPTVVDALLASPEARLSKLVVVTPPAVAPPQPLPPLVTLARGAAGPPVAASPLGRGAGWNPLLDGWAPIEKKKDA